MYRTPKMLRNRDVMHIGVDFNKCIIFTFLAVINTTKYTMFGCNY